jgi:hypothetical protein
MKKIIIIILLLALALVTSVRADVWAFNCGVASINGDFAPDGTTPNGLPSYTNSVGWHLFTFLVAGGTTTTNWELYFTPGPTATFTNSGPDLFTTWTGLAGSGFTNPPPMFSPFPILAQPLVNLTLNNFWATNGSRVTFSARGWNNSVAGVGSNTLSVLLGGNLVFTSPPTAGNHLPWEMEGQMYFDSTNMQTFVHFISGDTNFPSVIQSVLLTNFNITTPSFEIALDGSTDTNLMISSGRISSQFSIPGTGPASLDFVPAISQSSRTIVNSTDSTFGMGAGMMCWDSNYVYVSVGSNLWKRAAISTW